VCVSFFGGMGAPLRISGVFLLERRYFYPQFKDPIFGSLVHDCPAMLKCRLRLPSVRVSEAAALHVRQR
jgi:hypothetical protein